MTLLDEHVRRSILRYPLIFDSRWKVLRHLYLVSGNGYEWRDGELKSVFPEHLDAYPGDEVCRETFFDDLDRHDEMMAKFPRDEGFEAAARLRRDQRQFLLDHVDEIALDRDRLHHPVEVMDFSHASIEYGHAFNVPDDAEESYREGAIEVLRSVVYCTQWSLSTHPIHKAAKAALFRLEAMRPPMSPEQAKAIEEIVATLREETKPC